MEAEAFMCYMLYIYCVQKTWFAPQNTGKMFGESRRMKTRREEG